MVKNIKSGRLQQRKAGKHRSIERLLNEGRKLIGNKVMTLDDFLAVLTGDKWGCERSEQIVAYQQQIKALLGTTKRYGLFYGAKQ